LIAGADLARQLHLSPPAIHARVRHLEPLGTIHRYVALLDRAKVGYDMLCFINGSLQTHQIEPVERFRDEVQKMPEVLECHDVTGEYDYLLKVTIRNRQDLERFVVRRLTPVPWARPPGAQAGTSGASCTSPSAAASAAP
jgi:DNA-binding Lrp family transcriptional regulator